MEASKKRKLELGNSQKTSAYSLTNFDLSTFPPVDVSILKESYDMIQPQTKTSDLIHIYVPPSPSHWIALDRCNLYISLGLKADKTYTFKVPPGSGIVTQTAYGNYLLGTIFEQIDVLINGHYIRRKSICLFSNVSQNPVQQHS